MKSQILKYFLFISILLILLSKCTSKFPGWGDDGEIRVLADSTIWKATEPIFRKIFEKPIMTPQNETIFTIIKGDINKFKRFKNLIFLATLDGQGKIAELVKNNLSPEAKDKVKEGNYVFIKKDNWASYQLVMFLVSTDLERLVQKIEENKNYLFNIFDNYWNEAQQKQMYHREEQVDIEKYLLKKYGWMIRVQHDYKIFIENADSNFVMLRRMLPERWLFVHWFHSYDPSIITKKWCIKKRNEISMKYYGGDQVEEKYVQPDSEEVDFLGKRALKVTGLWRNDQKEAGGSFRNYSFYDEPSKRIYMLDYALFAPRFQRPKRNYIRQAEIMLHTFKTEHEISIKDLNGK